MLHTDAEFLVSKACDRLSHTNLLEQQRAASRIGFEPSIFISRVRLEAAGQWSSKWGSALANTAVRSVHKKIKVQSTQEINLT
jgi:hypothetical protein